jgi:hypothetical protein
MRTPLPPRFKSSPSKSAHTNSFRYSRHIRPDVAVASAIPSTIDKRELEPSNSPETAFWEATRPVREALAVRKLRTYSSALLFSRESIRLTCSLAQITRRRAELGPRSRHDPSSGKSNSLIRS